MAELHALWVTTVLAADAELDVRTSLAALLNSHLHQLANANLIQSRNFRAVEAFIVATAIYLLLSIATRATLNWFGQRFLFGGRRG